MFAEEKKAQRPVWSSVPSVLQGYRAIALAVVAVMVVTIMVAHATGGTYLFELLTAVLRLAAVGAVLANGFLQVVFSLFDTTLAAAVAGSCHRGRHSAGQQETAQNHGCP
jgi:hypothetical protein